MYKMFKWFSRHAVILLLIVIIVLAAFLRLYHLDSLPVSPYWEEVALGYDAYSILQTGKDHHGNPFPLIAFESFGDWKPSLYFYAAVPSIAVFGLSTWAVRLPSALAGIAMVYLVYVLVQQLIRIGQIDTWDIRSKAKQIGILAAFLLAIEPWAITFSRVAWEANLATALILGGIVLFFHFLEVFGKKQLIWLCVSLLLFSLSMYCYHAARLIVPLLVFCLFLWSLWYTKQSKHLLFKQLQFLFVGGLFFLLLISPLLIALKDPQVSSRFATENIFNNVDTIIKSNELKEIGTNSLIARLQFHRYVMFTRQLLINYTSYLNPDFLFVSGDTNMRHSVGYFSVLYPIDCIFLIAGFLFLIRKHKKVASLLILWIVIGLLPAAMSQPNPHALRALPTLPAWIALLSIGIFALIEVVTNKLKQLLSQVTKCIRTTNFVSPTLIRAFIYGMVIVIYLCQLGVFLLYYQTVYPIRFASWWVYGYQQMYGAVDSLEASLQNKTLPIYISRSQGRPAMYDWFYHRTDPHLVQASEATTPKDQSEFLAYQNTTYFSNLGEIKQRPAIVAVGADQLKQLQNKYGLESLKGITVIYSLDTTPIWYISLLL